MCDELAHRGFNICMISRNKAKIDEKLNILREKYPTIRMMGVEADLAKITNVA